MIPSEYVNHFPDGVLLAYGHEEHTTAVHLHKALDDLSEVHAIGPGNERPNPWIDSKLPLVWIESGVLWYPELALLRTRLTAAWIIDTHVQLYWRAILGRAFDKVFLAQRQAVTPTKRLGVDSSWLPLATSNYLIPLTGSFSKRTFDVAFVGSITPDSQRARVMEDLSQRFKVAPYQKYQTPAEMMETYSTARIVVNIPVRDDLNLRVFEGPAAGAFLVTPSLNGLQEILPADLYGEVLGQSPSDFVDAIGRALDLDDLPDRAYAARSLICEHHTYKQRAHHVLHVLSEGMKSGPRESRLARALALAHTRACQRGKIGELDSLSSLERYLWRAGASVINQVPAKTGRTSYISPEE